MKFPQNGFSCYPLRTHSGDVPTSLSFASTDTDLISDSPLTLAALLNKGI
jgi:hypothetical protein